jgi:hypothetical protein
MPATDSQAEMSSLIAAFRLSDNNEGWGPATAEPVQFKDLPYQKFSKADRIGKVILNDKREKK